MKLVYGMCRQMFWALKSMLHSSKTTESGLRPSKKNIKIKIKTI